MPTGHLQAASAWEGTSWSPGHSCYFILQQAVSALSFCQYGCFFLSGSSWSLFFLMVSSMFIPGVFPPLVLSFSSPQSSIAPYSPASPSPVLTNPSLSSFLCSLVCLFFMLFSATELIFSLSYYFFPAFELTSFSVLCKHKTENEGKEEIIKKKIKPIPDLILWDSPQNSSKHAKCEQTGP